MRPIDADPLGLTDMEIIMCDGDYKKALKMLIDKIEHAPTIEPEREKGEWIKKDHYTDRWGDRIEILRCPICEFKHDYAVGDTNHRDSGWFNFCPNCGADLRGEPDD